MERIRRDRITPMSLLLGASLFGLLGFSAVAPSVAEAVVDTRVSAVPVTSDTVSPNHGSNRLSSHGPSHDSDAIAYGFGSLKELMIGLEPVIDWPTVQVQAPAANPRLPLPPATTGEATPSRGLPESNMAIPDNPWQRAFAQPGPTVPRRFTRQPRTYPSFSSTPLDAQLRRYLTYMEAMGPADIFIVGSSRATQGVDPLILQQALAERGFSGIKVFNWGINGATAQVVDVLLREILTPAQLPQLVVWADGSRSFSSGRRDRTYENIRLSAGYRALSEGKRPFLTAAEKQQLGTLRAALTSPPPKLSQDLKAKLGVQVSRQPSPPLRNFFIDWCSDMQGPCDRSATFQSADGLTEAMDPSSTVYLEASGFQINSRQFIPQFYFQQFKKISGAHDGDYKNFSLFGDQHRALKRIQALSRQQNMPVVFLSLPLTNTYLDSIRQKREAAFITYMKAAAKDRNFSFYDFSQLWPNRNDFFIDPSHVNRYGAASVSWQFAKTIHPTLLKQIARGSANQTAANAASAR